METMGQPFQSPAEGHQALEERNVQRSQFQHTIKFALEHHYRDALNPAHTCRQLIDDIAHHPLNARIDLGVLKYVGAFHQ